MSLHRSGETARGLGRFRLEGRVHQKVSGDSLRAFDMEQRGKRSGVESSKSVAFPPPSVLTSGRPCGVLSRSFGGYLAVGHQGQAGGSARSTDGQRSDWNCLGRAWPGRSGVTPALGVLWRRHDS